MLHNLQTAFRDGVLDPNNTDAIVAMIKGHGLDPAARLQLHRNNTLITISEALGATFQAVKSLVGDDFFYAMAREYIMAHPPSQPVLNEYGGDFPAFIAAFGPASSLPYLADVAQLEWAFNESYFAADATPYDASILNGMAPEEILAQQLILMPHVRLVRSDYPIGKIFDMNRGDWQATDETIDLESGGENLLLYRKNLNVYVQPISDEDFAFLSAIAAQQSLGEAAAAGFQVTESFDLQSTFAGLLEAQLIGC